MFRSRYADSLAPRITIFAAALFAASPLLCPSAAFAQSGVKEIDGNVVVFDDNGEHKFTATPTHNRVPSGGTLTLVVKNINTFREKYTLKGATEDRHNASLPDSLKTLISKASPTFGGAPATGRSFAPHPPDTTVDVTAELATFNAKADALRNQITSFSTTHDPAILVDSIRYGKTNSDIRVSILSQIKQITPVVNGPGGDCWTVVEALTKPDDRDNVQDDFSAFSSHHDEITAIAKKIDTDFTSDLKMARTQFDDAYSALRSKLQPDKDPDKTFLATVTDPVVTSLDAQTDALAKTAPTNSALFREIFLLMMDPHLLPTRIVKSLDTSKDYATISVQIDTAPTALLLPSDTTNATQIKPLVSGDPSYSSTVYNSPRIATYFRPVMDFALGGVWTTLKQRNYYISPNPDTTVKNGFVREGASDNGNFGLGALAQLYYTTPLPLGLTVGPCLGVTADPVRYLMGGSAVLHLSDHVRLSFSYGAAYGKQTVLNGDTLNGDLLNPKVTALSSSVNTASVYRWGQFKAVTFTFSF